MNKLESYEVFRISDNEITFKTQSNTFYDVYFLDRNDFLSSKVVVNFPSLRLLEFGFDRFMFEKNCYDPIISSTLIQILNNTDWDNTIIFSRVYNPVGNHIALNRVYIKNLKRYNTNFDSYSIEIKTNDEYFILIVYYSKKSNITTQSFFEIINETIANVICNSTILHINIFCINTNMSY
ncbi:hypothetical protein [Porphyromonas sp.]|uniref:hypothetical protein n=1 Tax=Porphyromonas sp. TaxID=1924944 RepID=UPI0026DBF0A0|nr:hypothetical protein [Porphyromonas sp.]